MKNVKTKIACGVVVLSGIAVLRNIYFGNIEISETAVAVAFGVSLAIAAEAFRNV